MSNTKKFEYAAYSDAGLRKKRNEDSFYIPKDDDELDIAIVADGIGGYNAGDIASRKTVDIVTHIIKRSFTAHSASLLLSSSIQKANTAVLEYASTHEFCEGMGTTIVAALYNNRKWVIANIGDSRAYLYRAGKLSQISVDHSLVQEMHDEGSITREEMRTNPYRNIITRAIGTDDEVVVDIFYENLKTNDIILLCSDGLNEHLTDDEMADMIKSSNDFADLPKRMVEKANALGGRDNTTVVLLRHFSERRSK